MNVLGIQPVDNWKNFYKMLSMWFFLAVAAAPELYSLAIVMDILQGDSTPEALNRIIKLIAFAGAASRLIQQKAVHPKPIPIDDGDKADGAS